MSVHLIAEVGTTCNGKLADALKLADVVKASGADVIKYMLIGADHFMADRSVEYTYTWAGGTKTVNMHEMFKGLEFTYNEWCRITEHCRAIGLPWYLTVDYLDGIKLAEDLGCPTYKLSAWDIRNFPLIRAMAKTRKPIQIDLGPAVLGEILTICHEIKKVMFWSKADVTLLHSTHSRESADCNLNTIPFLASHMELPVGWSSPGKTIFPDELAIAAGAGCVEKRLTLDGKADGHHNLLALEPDEFKDWVEMLRNVEGILGEHDVRPSFEDIRQKVLWFTSIVAACDIRQGETIHPALLAAKRPGHGISPLYMDRFYGKRAARNIEADSILDWSDVEIDDRVRS